MTEETLDGRCACCGKPVGEGYLINGTMFCSICGWNKKRNPFMMKM